MLEVLKFIFTNFWTWLGTVILILYLGNLIPDIHIGTTVHNKITSDESTKRRI